MSMNDSPLEVGRLLRAGTTGFVAGCRVSQLQVPSFGALVQVPLGVNYAIYGLIHDLRIDDDGLVRQLTAAETVNEAVILDNRLNRNVPIEMSVLAVGYSLERQVYHLLPPRPPLSLDVIFLCDQLEICEFTRVGRFGYFRHILRAADLPVGELLAAHLQQTHLAQLKYGDPAWLERATQELITLLRDDYASLMSVLGALSEIYS
jgi:hypothetical protein